MIYTEMEVVRQTWLKFDLWLWLPKKKKSKYLKYGKAYLLSTFVLRYDDKKEKQCDMYVWLNKSQTLKGKLVIMNSFF